MYVRYMRGGVLHTIEMTACIEVFKIIQCLFSLIVDVLWQLTFINLHFPLILHKDQSSMCCRMLCIHRSPYPNDVLATSLTDGIVNGPLCSQHTIQRHISYT